MPALPDSKAERYCQLIVSGLTQVEAYIQSRPDRVMRRRSASEDAQDLMKQPGIRRRIEELRAPVIAKVRKKFEYTLDDAMAEINRTEQLAQALLQPAVMLQAIKLKAQLQKILVSVKETRVETPFDQASTDELLEVLSIVRERKKKLLVEGVVISESGT